MCLCSNIQPWPWPIQRENPDDKTIQRPRTCCWSFSPPWIVCLIGLRRARKEPPTTWATCAFGTNGAQPCLGGKFVDGKQNKQRLLPVIHELIASWHTQKYPKVLVSGYDIVCFDHSYQLPWYLPSFLQSVCCTSGTVQGSNQIEQMNKLFTQFKTCIIYHNLVSSCIMLHACAPFGCAFEPQKIYAQANLPHVLPSEGGGQALGIPSQLISLDDCIFRYLPSWAVSETIEEFARSDITCNWKL